MDYYLNLLNISIGFGMVVSFFIAELLGVTAGGIIVPGYIAFYLDAPEKILSTFFVSFIVFATLKVISKFVIVYGKRRFMLCICLGFIFGVSMDQYMYLFFSFGKDSFIFDRMVIGNIIPGLIANWFERQGVVRTISSILITASIVKLIVVIIEQVYLYV